MRIDFVNRDIELRALETAAKRGGLLVVYGRRRVGKTRLLSQWLGTHGGMYSQAIELPETFKSTRSLKTFAPG